MKQTTRQRHLPAALAALLLAGTVLWMYARLVLDPDQYFAGDLVSFYQPFRAHTVRCLGQGDFPLWTAAVFAGSPTVADAQLGLFYPPNLLHLAMGFPAAELALFLLHLLWAGLGMAWCARRLGADRWTSLLAGLATSASGFYAVHAVHPNFIHTAAWVPWLLGSVHRLTTAPGLQALGATALLVGLTVLSGGLQIAYLGLGLALLLGIAWAATLPHLDHRSRLLGGLGVLGATGLGLALAAVQILPTAEFAALSVRAHGVTLDLARGYAMAPRQALQLAVPFAFGLPGQTPYRGGAPFAEAFAYAGVLTLPLAITGAVGAGPWRQRVTRWLLAAVAGAALLVAMGPESPLDLHRLAWHLLPGFDRFRAPGRLLFLVGLALALLASLGLEDLLPPRSAPATSPSGAALPHAAPSRPAAGAVYTAATALTLGAVGGILLLGSGPRPLLPPAAGTVARRAALGAAALLGAGWLLLRLAPGRGVPRRAVLGGVLALAALDLAGTGRKLLGPLHPPPGTDLARTAHRLPKGIRREATRPSGTRHRVVFTPDSFFMLQNLGVLQGYDNVRAYSPVLLGRTWDLLVLANTGHLPPAGRRLSVDHNHNFLRRYHGPIARLLGVRWVLSHDRGGRPGIRRDLRWRIRTLPAPLPRAFVLYRGVVAHSRDAAGALLGRLPLDRVAVLSRPVPGLRAPSQATVAAGRTGGESLPPPTPARIVHRNRCTGDAAIALEATAPGLLVFTEGFHPGWRARVDGRPTQVVRTDHALMGVPVPAGRHRVTLQFRPRSLWLGAATTGASLLLVLGLLGWPILRRRDQRLRPRPVHTRSGGNLTPTSPHAQS